MGNIFTILLVYPLLNLLAFFIWISPAHNAVIGIILLTLVVRFALLVPSKRAAQSQRKMQELQPLMDELKKEYGTDQQALANAQMELWKKNGINPFASCLPILIQFPILYGLYFAISRGLGDTQHLYSWVPHVTSFPTHFLWLQLLKPDPYFILPVIAAALQYVQLWMTLPKTKGPATDSAQAMQRQTLYILPLLTLFIANRFPSGVAVYWIATTLFSIVQQYYVNKEKLKLTGLTSVVKEVEAVHPENKIDAEKVLSTYKELEVSSTENKKGVSVTVRKRKS